LPTLSLSALKYLVKQQQQIGGKTQLCMHKGYIIISEKLQSYVILFGIAILYSMLNMTCLAIYSQILRKL
jgi:hypothetical protein